MNTIYVRHVMGMGRGVFANKDFAPGEIIEVCPVLLFPTIDVPDWLTEYAFDFGNSPALALGYGSLYNHSAKPNATCDFKTNEKTLIIKACHSISAKSQIYIDYGWNEDDLKVAWRKFRSLPPSTR